MNKRQVVNVLMQFLFISSVDGDGRVGKKSPGCTIVNCSGILKKAVSLNECYDSWKGLSQPVLCLVICCVCISFTVFIFASPCFFFLSDCSAYCVPCNSIWKNWKVRLNGFLMHLRIF